MIDAPIALALWDGLVEPLQFGFMVKALWVSSFVGKIDANPKDNLRLNNHKSVELS